MLKILLVLLAGLMLVAPASAGSLPAQPPLVSSGPARPTLTLSLQPGQVSEQAPGGRRVLVFSGKRETARQPAPPPRPRSLVASSSAAIIVNYTGFSPAAQAAFQHAVNIWAGLINLPVTIRVDASFASLGSNVLGSAGAASYHRNFPNAPQTGVWYPAALANRYAGYDLNPSLPDIDASFSSDFSGWYFGTDGNPPWDKIDFVSVVLHELCHGLGFADSFNYSAGLGSWGFVSSPLVYDRQVVNGLGQSLINTTLFPNNSLLLGAQLVSDGLYFNGASARANNGGVNPRLYAPAVYNGGSSVAHLDEIFNNTPNALMTYSIGTDEVLHSPGPVGLSMMQDMGWDIPLLAPSGLSALTVSAGQVQLNWTDNAVNETGYSIEAKAGPGGLYTVIGSAAANATSFLAGGLLNGTTYYFRVRAAKSGLLSDYSPEAPATTLFPAPTGLTLTPAAPDQFNLAWTDNSNSESGFTIESKAGPGAAFASLATVGPGVTTYQAGGLQHGTPYYFRVRAFTSFGSSAYSGEAGATTGFPAPSGLALSTAGPAAITLNWSDNSNSETGFNIESKSGPGGAYSLLAVTGAGATSFTAGGLNPSATYYFRVQAVNPYATSAYSVEASRLTPPAGPTGLTAQAASGLSTNLAWTDNGADETAYRVERSPGAPGNWTLLPDILSPGSTAFTDSGLAAGTAYFYRVYAVNGGGASAFSNEAVAVTLGAWLVTANSDTNDPQVANSLTWALAQAGQSATAKTVVFALTQPGQPLVVTAPVIVPTGVSLSGACGPAGPTVRLQGTGLAGPGLVLYGSNNIYGLKIYGFAQPQIRAIHGGQALQNNLRCVAAG